MENVMEELMNRQSKNEIKTESLQINGNILVTDQTTLQLSNISSVTSGQLGISIPYMLIAIWGVVSLVLIPFLILLSIISLLVLGIYIYYLYQKKINSDSYLHIKLNSGADYTIFFANEEFLLRVKGVIETAFNKNDERIQINIKDQTIIGDNNMLDSTNEDHSVKVGDNNMFNSTMRDESVNVGEIKGNSLNNMQIGRENNMGVEPLNWTGLASDLKSVIDSLTKDSELKEASIAALKAVNEQDEAKFKKVVTTHKSEFISELFINISGSVLGQVVNRILGLG
ncbi:hypothetical protein [uncultured Lactococcus sp.]|uniref:hypothetical protein n=1 Tax=uncultured Lactococcus sp. TaxID=167973 RepID=UPI002598A064|nr:hypothetical protein [uncultured Lactococcus sp.]